MSFDPFGDFETRGYLRNVEAEKDPKVVKHLEHIAFASGLPEALAYLRKKNVIEYRDVIKVHGILFEPFYPWAGKDRIAVAPKIAVVRGAVEFAFPQKIRDAADLGLRIGNDPDKMRNHPGL